MKETTSAQSSRLWVWFLVGRAVAYTLLGGLVTFVFGGLLFVPLGALLGAIVIDKSESLHMVLECMYFGSFIGRIGGGAMGLVTFAVLGFVMAPQRRLIPPRRLIFSTLVGMVLGGVGALASGMVLVGLISLVKNGTDWVAFAELAGDEVAVLMLSTLAMMMGGGVAGAIWGFKNWVKSGVPKFAASTG